MVQFSFQVASDIVRDGLGIELIDENDDVMAEVFRSDRDKTLVIDTFDNALPLAVIEQLIACAKRQLDPFEDGTPLSEAMSFEMLPHRRDRDRRT